MESLIISDPKVMMGKPVIAGTRITVELILDMLAAGESMEQIIAAHPRLTLEGVQASFSVITSKGIRIRRRQIY